MDGKFSTSEPLNAIIPAGGLGTRLRSVVNSLPKCMAPVCGKPFLHYLLHYVARFPVSKVVLSVGYLREVIFDWVEKNEKAFPFAIDYAIEETPLGTGGGVKKALLGCDTETVLVLNGDTYYNINVNAFYDAHRASKKNISLALKPLCDFDRYGNVELDKNHVVTEFCEKKYCEQGHINGGIYLLKRRGLLDAMPDKFSFESDFLQPQAKKGSVNGFVSDAYFIDIGVPADYERADREFVNFEAL